jgi:Mlc titration factor MtfA (ptsG expression regulator)
MLVTSATNRKNRLHSFLLSAVIVIVATMLGPFYPWCLLGVLLGPFVYWWLRRPWKRRLHIMAQPFPKFWEGILHTRVAYFNALSDKQQDRFRKLVKVFLDETRITGIRTDVDETTRVLVAASAIIPVFNIDDWEYSRLGEVLIYPGSFDHDYRTDGNLPRNTLGMVGTGHLSGVMILSKPALLTGFDITNDEENVGIHEFAHLVDGADGAIDGIPPGVPPEVAKKWIEWVGQELAMSPEKRTHIKDYAYTNEAEYFAVLTEYFFETPGILQKKNPELYRMLVRMFRQDTATFLPGVMRHRAPRIGRNSRCPCNSGKKYKKCCLRHSVQGVPD